MILPQNAKMKIKPTRFGTFDVCVPMHAANSLRFIPMGLQRTVRDLVDSTG